MIPRTFYFILYFLVNYTATCLALAPQAVSNQKLIAPEEANESERIAKLVEAAGTDIVSIMEGELADHYSKGELAGIKLSRKEDIYYRDAHKSSLPSTAYLFRGLNIPQREIHSLITKLVLDTTWDDRYYSRFREREFAQALEKYPLSTLVRDRVSHYVPDRREAELLVNVTGELEIAAAFASSNYQFPLPQKGFILVIQCPFEFYVLDVKEEGGTESDVSLVPMGIRLEWVKALLPISEEFLF